jgi:hypothetical protein
VLQLPQGVTASAWAFYKDRQLALLLHDPAVCTSPGIVSPTHIGGGSAAVGSSSSGSSSLVLLELSGATWTPVATQELPSQQDIGSSRDPTPTPTSPSSGSSSSVLQQCLAAGAVSDLQDLPSRSRVLQPGRAGQLAVSRARGLGSLVTDLQHLLLLDLEEDGDPGEDEGSEGEEGEGGDDMQS